MKLSIKTIIATVALSILSASVCLSTPFRLPVVSRPPFEDCSVKFVESSGALTSGDSAVVYTTTTTKRCVAYQLCVKVSSGSTGVSVGFGPLNIVDPLKTYSSWVVGDYLAFWGTAGTSFVGTAGIAFPTIFIPNGAQTVKLFNDGGASVASWSVLLWIYNF
jgi:hypothetical protein